MNNAIFLSFFPSRIAILGGLRSNFSFHWATFHFLFSFIVTGVGSFLTSKADLFWGEGIGIIYTFVGDFTQAIMQLLG